MGPRAVVERRSRPATGAGFTYHRAVRGLGAWALQQDVLAGGDDL